MRKSIISSAVGKFTYHTHLSRSTAGSPALSQGPLVSESSLGHHRSRPHRRHCRWSAAFLARSFPAPKSHPASSESAETVHHILAAACAPRHRSIVPSPPGKWSVRVAVARLRTHATPASVVHRSGRYPRTGCLPLGLAASVRACDDFCWNDGTF